VYVNDILFIHHDRAYINKIAKAFYRYIKLEELDNILNFPGNCYGPQRGAGAAAI
jgi:hypothetical protein